MTLRWKFLLLSATLLFFLTAGQGLSMIRHLPSSWLIAQLITSALLGGLVITVAAEWLVFRRIRRVTDWALAAMAEGGAGEECPIAASDELGAMAAWANHVLRRQQELGAALHEIARGNLTVTVSPLSDRDAVPLALEEMTRALRQRADTLRGLADGELLELPTPSSSEDLFAQALTRLADRMKVVTSSFDSMAEQGDAEVLVTPHSTQDALAHAFNRMVTANRQSGEIARRISEGDLTVDVQPRSERDVSGHALKQRCEQFRKTLGGLMGVSARLSASASQIQSTAVELEKSTMEQVGAINETATTMAELSASQRQVAQSAELMSERAGKAEGQISEGRRSVGQVAAGLERIQTHSDAVSTRMASLSDQSRAIGKIAVTIRAITEQINLLALNAAIEAARAGEQGRGFAVVAQEVRKLAERTSKAAEEIGGLIDGIQVSTETTALAAREGRASVEEGVRDALRAEGIFETMSGALSEIFESVRQIREATGQQDHATGEIVVAMRDVDSGMKESVDGLGKTVEAAQEMSELANELEKLVTAFRL
ncbi:MAG TPA: methyl-accepting chemotaxis protein [Methylomirabilota bacterium]|nr:methyl-accepting chemotaxis protein [Methylomirabilota bacterium]